jgi:FMN phosphatase YigB (HAD superfamily)
VLDIGNVLLRDPISQLLKSLSEEGSRTWEELRQFYLYQVRDRMWSGDMSEDEFWGKLCSYAHTKVENELWHQRLLEIMIALPAIEKMHDWSSKSEIWLLSNHFAEWPLGRLRECGVMPTISKVLISSETHFLKPNPKAFDPVTTQLSASTILYVDDKIVNVEVATKLGINGLFADLDGDWIAMVDKWMMTSS